jgi:DNA-binding transcriptional LysR family regulator
VTRRLQALESSLGAILIHREAPPLVLTPEGAEAYRHAKNVLATMEAMQMAMQPDAEMTGEFRLGISMSLGDTMLATPIEHLRRDFPNLQIQAVIDESQNLMRKVEKRELDAVIIVLANGYGIHEGLSGELLNQKPLGVVVSKKTPIGSSARLADFLDYPWALNPPGCTARDELARASGKLGKSLRILMESSSAELKYALIEIEKGLGIGLARVSNLVTSRYADRLRVIVPSDFQRRLGMWLVYSPNIGRLKAPLDCVRQVLRAPNGKV